MTDYNCSIFFWVRKKVRELFPFQHLPAYFQDLTQPGMWGMGNVYNGIDDVVDRGKQCLNFEYFLLFMQQLLVLLSATVPAKEAKFDVLTDALKELRRRSVKKKEKCCLLLPLLVLFFHS